MDTRCEYQVWRDDIYMPPAQRRALGLARLARALGSLAVVSGAAAVVAYACGWPL